MLGGLIGLLGGGLLRLAPEVLKFFDRRGDRAHELAMFDKQLVADRQRASDNLAMLQAQHAADADKGDLDALLAAVGAQGGKTGVAWVDALNAFVRPFLTLYWCVVLYTFVLVARLLLLTGQGVPAPAAVLQLWGANEDAIVASMLSFWFVDRALRKGGGVAAAH